MSDGVNVRARRRAHWAVALLLFGALVAFVPGLMAGDEFLVSPIPPFTWARIVRTYDEPIMATGVPMTIFIPPDGSATARSETTYVSLPATSLVECVRSDVTWAITIATLLVAPLIFLWWRRSGIGFGRVVGVVCCIAASSAISASVPTRPCWEAFWLERTWLVVPLGGALMAAAFLLAPAPRPRDDG